MTDSTLLAPLAVDDTDDARKLIGKMRDGKLVWRPNVSPVVTADEAVEIVTATNLAGLQAQAPTQTRGDVAVLGNVVYRHDGVEFVPTNYSGVFANDAERLAATPTDAQITANATFLQSDTNTTWCAKTAAPGGFARLDQESTVASRADIRDAANAGTDLVQETGIRTELDLRVLKSDEATPADVLAGTDGKHVDAADLKVVNDALDAHTTDAAIHVLAGGTALQLYRKTADNLGYEWTDITISSSNTVSGVGAPGPANVTEAGYYYVQLDAALGTNDIWGPSVAGNPATWPAQADFKSADPELLSNTDVTSISGLPYTKYGTISTERLDEWGRSRRMRRVFNHPGPGNFDFVGLGYPDRTAIFIRNVSSSNGISIDYGTGGANTLNITRASGTTQTITALDSFNIQPSEIAVVEKDGTQVYVSIFPGERVTVYTSYTAAVAGGFTPYDGLVLIRDTGELFGRKTSTNARPFPADGKENADWYKIGGTDVSTDMRADGEVQQLGDNIYFFGETVGAAPAVPALGENGEYRTGIVQIDRASWTGAEPIIWTEYQAVEEAGTIAWSETTVGDEGGSTRHTFRASDRLQSLNFTLADRRPQFFESRQVRQGLTLEELTTGNADWTVDPTGTSSNAASIAAVAAGYTRLKYRHAINATGGYDYFLDWRLIGSEYTFIVQDIHNAIGGTTWGINRQGGIYEIVYKYAATDPVKPNWQATTAYVTTDAVLGQAPTGVAETAGDWFVMVPTSDRTSTATLDAAEWGNWTVTPLVPTKQSVVVATEAELPDPATVLVGSVAAVTNDGSRNGSYTAVGADPGLPATMWEPDDHHHEILEDIQVHVRSAGTNAGSAVQITFTDLAGNDYPPTDWTVSTLPGGLQSYTDATFATYDNQPYTGNIGIGRNKDGFLLFRYIGSTPNGLSAVTYTGTNGANSDGQIIVNFAGTNDNVTFANKAAVVDTDWTKQEAVATDTVVYPGPADAMQVGVINIRYQDDPALTPGQIPPPELGKEYAVTILPVNRGDTAGTIEGETTHYFCVDRGAGAEWIATKGSTLSDDWIYTTDGMTIDDGPGQQFIWVDGHSLTLPDFSVQGNIDLEFVPTKPWSEMTYSITEAAGYTYSPANQVLTGFSDYSTVRLIVDTVAKTMFWSIGGSSASLGAEPFDNLADLPAATATKVGQLFSVLTDATTANRGLYISVGPAIGGVATDLVPA